ncbi:MAG: PAS domain S-box protein [Terriglobales bacterium]
MDRENRQPDDQASRLSRLDHEESRLWRIALFFVALLGVGVAAAAWQNMALISSHLGVLVVPVLLAILVVVFAIISARKRQQIALLRAELRGVELATSAPPTEGQVEQMVEVIRRSQRGFRDLVDSFEDVVLSVSLDGTIQAANRAFASLLGAEFTAFVLHPVNEFITRPTAAEAERLLPRLLERRHWSGILEVQLKHEAKPRFFDCSAQLIQKDGRNTGISIWGRDVTHQRERESRFTDLFESLHEGVYFSTPGGQWLDANQALVQMLGFQSKAELQAFSVEDLYVDLSERTRWLSDLNRDAVILDREIHLRRKDGRVITCLDSARAIYDTDGRVIRYQGTLVDITQKREMEAQLEQQREFNNRLIESFPDAILVLDKDLRHTFASPRIREITGFDPEEIVGTHAGPESTEPSRLYHDVLTGKEKIGSTEYLSQHRNGMWQTLRCRASALVGHNNEVVGVVVSLRDITVSKQIEQQLVQAERLAAMGQMIDGFAHELNNPLTAIMGAIDLLDTAGTEKEKKHLKLLKEQSRRAVEVVQNLLFFSRPPTRGTTRLNLNDLMQRTLLLHQYSLRVNNISVDFLPEPSLPPFEGDANQLMQVFLNLMINAEQAIRTVRDRGSIRVRMGRAEQSVWISFQDDGPGVPDDMLGNIFDPFYSTKRPGGGTGMGLSVAMGIVKSYGGRIDFQSVPGAGAIFTVSLPLKVEIEEQMSTARAN